MKRLVEGSDGQRAESYDGEFSATVIAWQKQAGRHTLPWQNTRDAYRIWLSEIMLQQTQVSAVIPYYQRFLQRFPDVASLAAAPAEDVMAHWSGLGYYSRARNLHRCAQIVMQEHGGVFPPEPEVLAELPGIGRSTAAAIAAFAYGARAAILDGNVKRVFARVFGIDTFPGEKKTEDQLWRRALALLPEQGIEAYTQGLMDLGATVCTRSRPSCAVCPLAQACVARIQGRTAELPVRKAKKATPEKSTNMLVISDGARVLLIQRPDHGIWGGLLSLPELDEELPAAPEAARAQVMAAASLFTSAHACQPLATFAHGFTHFRLHITPWCIDTDAPPLQVAEAGRGSGSQVWLAYAQIADAPLPAPVKKLLLALFASPFLPNDAS